MAALNPEQMPLPSERTLGISAIAAVLSLVAMIFSTASGSVPYTAHAIYLPDVPVMAAATVACNACHAAGTSQPLVAATGIGD